MLAKTVWLVTGLTCLKCRFYKKSMRTTRPAIGTAKTGTESSHIAVTDFDLRLSNASLFAAGPISKEAPF